MAVLKDWWRGCPDQRTSGVAVLKDWWCGCPDQRTGGVAVLIKGLVAWLS